MSQAIRRLPKIGVNLPGARTITVKTVDNNKTFANRVVLGKLIDMGNVVRPEFSGILMPEEDVGAKKIGITDQLLQEAGVYHERYSAIPYFKWLIEQAIAGRLGRQPDLILDIGSGSGNTVLPLLDLFPTARVVATDLSENLLAILRDHISADSTKSSRVALVCLDATRADYIEGAADLVVGGAVLHHLLDPAECVRRACKALSRNGTAIFFEPFEAGNAILRLAYERILQRSADGAVEQLSGDTARVLRAMVHDYAVRAGSDKSAPVFQEIDDKWLFTKSFFEEILAPLGDYALEIEMINSSDSAFSRQTLTNLRLSSGLSEDAAAQALPGWAWDILKDTDAAFSRELKRDLPIEGRIVINRKS